MRRLFSNKTITIILSVDFFLSLRPVSSMHVNLPSRSPLLITNLAPSAMVRQRKPLR